MIVPAGCRADPVGSPCARQSAHRPHSSGTRSGGPSRTIGRTRESMSLATAARPAAQNARPQCEAWRHGQHRLPSSRPRRVHPGTCPFGPLRCCQRVLSSSSDFPFGIAGIRLSTPLVARTVNHSRRHLAIQGGGACTSCVCQMALGSPQKPLRGVASLLSRDRLSERPPREHTPIREKRRPEAPHNCLIW